MSVRHETKFVWGLTRNHKVKFFKTENDLAEDAAMEGFNEDEDIITFDSVPIEGQIEIITQQVIAEIKSGQFFIKDRNWKQYEHNKFYEEA